MDMKCLVSGAARLAHPLCALQDLEALALPQGVAQLFGVGHFAHAHTPMLKMEAGPTVSRQALPALMRLMSDLLTP